MRKIAHSACQLRVEREEKGGGGTKCAGKEGRTKRTV